MRQFQIEQARLDHMQEVFNIEEFWKEKATKGDFAKGSIKHILTLEQLKALIADRQVVVALHENKVIGYYLTNSLFINDSITKRKEIISKLIYDGLLPKGRYIYQVQAAIKEEFLGLGVSKLMLLMLKRLVCDRLDYLSGIIRKENYHGIIHQHERAGWEIVGEFEVGIIAIMPTKVLE